METQTTVSRLSAVIALYDLQTTYYLNAIDGISDKDTHNRLNTKANHIAWLAGSVVEERFELARVLGRDLGSTAHELFKDNKGIQDDATYPSLEVYRSDWNKISPILRETLLNLTDEKLDSKFEMMPGMEMTYFELITFISYREANCIGQIALWRRLLGYPPMKYM